MTFNPQEHTINLKGKDYLTVDWRIIWFHEEHPIPSGAIETHVESFANPLVVKATIYIDGQAIATGHAGAIAKGNAVWSGREIEKAETAAIGRALKHAGYGTQYDDEDDTDYLADSPIEQNAHKQRQNAPPARAAQPPSSPNEPQNAPNGIVDTIPYVPPGDKQYWPVFWTYAHPLFEAAGYAQKHRSASVGKLTQEGKINIDTMPVALAVEAVRRHLVERQAS